MPVTFARLRIAGFKSFAEPVSVEILPGLTGIVGPNGCGKSNVVEALRWCMGESSARSLRGGEMDDLIFAGTAARPARNLAEVVLTLEDAAGLAPPPLHEQAELQISRRIERGAGSAYRINGREARARDVQTLFADLASGARSSAMVSQGRVAAIVGARPEERRSVLEEAAGITGLHARRHEAELKLRATEANLARAEDLRSQLETQTRSLAGQAEQAARYRVVAEELRTRESALLALLHARANRAVRLTGTARLEAERASAAAEAALAERTDAETRRVAALGPPREAEALARTLLERRRIEAERAARDDERAREESIDADRRLVEAQEDHAAALGRLEDAEREVRRLQTERDALEAERDGLPEQLRAAEDRRADAERAIEVADQAHRRDEAAAITAHARRDQHARDAEAAADRTVRATALLDGIEAELAETRATMPDPAEMQRLDAMLADARDALSAAEARLDEATTARADAARRADAAGLAAADADRRHQAARAAEQDAGDRVDRLAREQSALEARLAEAERNLVPANEREAAQRLVRDAAEALSAAAAGLADAETARSRAASARLDAQGRSRDEARARAQAETALSRAISALDQATAEQDQARREHDEAVAAGLPDGTLAAAAAARESADAALASVVDALGSAEAGLQEAEKAVAARSEALAKARDGVARLAAEAEGLAQALAATSGAEAAQADQPTVGALLQVPAGLEGAVAAVLGDGLEAGCDPDAAQGWRSMPPLSAQALPPGARALRDLVGAPEQLARILDRAGLIEPDAAGDALQADLEPGQCLVTRDGALWRWDGFRVVAGQPGPASIRLQQRARHRDVLLRLREAQQALAPANAALEAARNRRDAAANEVQALRRDRGLAEQKRDAAQREHDGVSLADARNRARLQALAPRLARADALLEETRSERDSTAAALAALPPPHGLEAAAAAAALAETEATALEQERRRARADADAALEASRARDAALAARHATHETTRRSLQPALDRTRDELAVARAALDTARTSPDAAAPDAAVRAASQAAVDALAATETEAACRAARDACRTALTDRNAERDRIATLLRDGAARIAAFEARRGEALLEHEAAMTASSVLEAAGGALPDAAAALEAAQRSEAALAAAREAGRRAEQACGALMNAKAAIEARHEPLRTGLADWSRREEMARAASADAERRLVAARDDAQRRHLDPDAEAARHAAIARALATAEQEHQASLEGLRAAEAGATAAQAARRDAESAMTAARETLLRAEGREEQARAILARLLAETPEPPAEVPDDLTDNAEAALRRRVAALVRERDAMGPVNLRAELELAEATERMEAIAREREEIETAIARLRGQIGHLNREGRERLLAVFEQVDRHFQALFARMFNGGRAHLGMVGSDDPLEAGLEIYAQPPAKKLATLSLLSGGEQALTALSLVFAVFRCNPAPICVLDEVDAPLDDANVERFCALLGDMVREAGTRFLVVTHHQLTMAHMDRLYGVTMQERGVSRVLSVDLSAAAAMVD